MEEIVSHDENMQINISILLSYEATKKPLHNCTELNSVIPWKQTSVNLSLIDYFQL